MTDEATAFVPGHVTGFFSVHRHDDPAIAGSRGAGLTLTDGVTVTVRPAEERTVVLDGESISMEPVESVLDALDATARVEATSDLPLGAGFGVSGAMALGAALATNTVFDRRRSENELVTIAHVAEVRAGTGLGDVVAQARGGIPIRLEPGAPAYNALDGVPTSARIEYLTLGDLSTSDVLADDTDSLTVAGERALADLLDEPTLERFVESSRRFARESGLLTPQLRVVIDDVTAIDGQAAMAMLGETVFAVGTGLSDAGYAPESCAVHPAGATIR